jgi:hypothetical protein
MSYTYNQMLTLLTRELDMQGKLAATRSNGLHVPSIMGPPGIGKTALVAKMADDSDKLFLHLELGDMGDVTELTGLLLPSDIKRDNAQGIPILKVGLEETIAKACIYPSILFLDDIDKSSNAQQGAMLGLIANRQIRSYKLHAETLIIAAGNRPEDDVIARNLSESLRTRLTMLEMRADLDTWCAWARASGLPGEIEGFLRWKPAMLHGKTGRSARFPTPRGWEEAGIDMKAHPDPMQDLLGDRSNNNWRVIVSMRCGEETASDFWAWYTQVRRIDIEQIMKSGTCPALTSATDEKLALTQYAAIFALTTHLEKQPLSPKKTSPGLAIFVESLSNENRVAFLAQCSDVVRKHLEKFAPAVLARIVESMQRS